MYPQLEEAWWLTMMERLVDALNFSICPNHNQGADGEMFCLAQKRKSPHFEHPSDPTAIIMINITQQQL